MIKNLIAMVLLVFMVTITLFTLTSRSFVRANDVRLERMLATKYPTKKSKSPTAYPIEGPSLEPTSSPTVFTPDKTKYNIKLLFVDEMQDEVKKALLDAKSKWEKVIKHDLQSTYLYQKNETCIVDWTRITEDIMVDDLLIFAKVLYIDGPFDVLARAAPCHYVSNTKAAFTRVGVMEIDIDDVEYMIKDGILLNTLTHEMGHIIGIGNYWEHFGLLKKPTRKDRNAYYTGEGGILGQKLVGGKGKPIVESKGATGTKFGHWDQDTYYNELMTGYAESSQMPFSNLTLLSLRDFGYDPDVNEAERYKIPKKQKKSLRGEKEKGASLDNDIIEGPLVKGEAIPY